MTKNALATTLAAAAALLAAASAASAGFAGSDFSEGPATTLGCGYSTCTMGWGAEGWNERSLEEGEIVTSWQAHLSPGARARLRVLRRDDDYKWSPVAASDWVTGSAEGGRQSFRTHIPVTERRLRVAIDLEGAARVGVADDPAFGIHQFHPALADGEARWVDLSSGELLVQARTEGDADRDGKGDVTEDDCIFSCSSGGGSGGGGGGSDSGSGSASVTPSPTTEVSPPSSPTSSATTGAGEERVPFSVDPRGLLRSGVQGRQGWVDLYVKNGSVETQAASFVVKAGARRVATAKLYELESGDATNFAVRLGAPERKALRRRGKVKLTVEGAATLANGHKHEVRQPLTVLTGGDARYDGTYRGPGPFVMVVERGTVRTISSMVLAYCVETKRQMQLNIFTTDGFPALVGRDGSFAIEGASAGAQSNTYRGKLSLKGTGKGYASAFKSNLMTSGGRWIVEGCTGATNWTVKRDR